MGYYGGGSSATAEPSAMQLLRYASGTQFVDMSGYDDVLDSIDFAAGDLGANDMLLVVTQLEDVNGDLNDWWLEDGNVNTIASLAYSNEPSITQVLLMPQDDGKIASAEMQVSLNWMQAQWNIPEAGYPDGDWTLRLYASWYAPPGGEMDQSWHWWVYRLRGGV